MANERYRHLLIDERFRKREDYTSPPRNVSSAPRAPRERRTHGEYLLRKFDDAWSENTSKQAVTHSERDGVYLEFKSDPEAALVTKSLEDLRSKKVRLLNVRQEIEDEITQTYATVYVSNDKRMWFINKLSAYLGEDTAKGEPKNATLIDSINDIRNALLVESFWTDKQNLIPDADADYIEVWLSGDGEEIETSFRGLCDKLSILVENGSILFPERRVLVVQANRTQLELLSTNSDHIAEYRKAKETAAFWLDLDNTDQSQWVRDLIGRLDISNKSDVAVCILDTGVNNGHPLIAPILENSDCHAYENPWGTHDHQGHGTLMAGVSGFGDLREALTSQLTIPLRHCLESVKILPPGQTGNPKGHWGYITARACALAELNAPTRKRIICLAITSTDTRDQGRPSSWSAEIDALASGAMDDFKRLFIVSAGNIEDTWLREQYPDGQITESIHDPAQAWNALTVGAYTDLARITDPQLSGYAPLAPQGGLSPFTSTSQTWNDAWPLKPDIVMEGGNLAVKSDELSDESNDLCVISTFHEPHRRLLEGFNMTSAATAQASWMAAQIYKDYPEYWPETIRALMVHSASWTDELKRQFLRNPTNPNKADLKGLIRICGWGVPNLERACYTAGNSLTLISEAMLQPFEKNSTGNKTKDMHLYQLPWPKDVLLSLPPETDISMRVTLSYFMEPGPGEVGWKDRYRYPSHQLRFSIIRPEETVENFHARISAAAESDPELDIETAGDSNYWTLGSQARSKGSLHSDIWKGSAQQLASSNTIAIYPVIGWWRERAHLNKCNKECRYSLIVTIHTPNEAIDLYVPVAAQIGIPIPTTQ